MPGAFTKTLVDQRTPARRGDIFSVVLLSAENLGVYGIIKLRCGTRTETRNYMHGLPIHKSRLPLHVDFDCPRRNVDLSWTSISQPDLYADFVGYLALGSPAGAFCHQSSLQVRGRSVIASSKTYGQLGALTMSFAITGSVIDVAFGLQHVSCSVVQVQRPRSVRSGSRDT